MLSKLIPIVEDAGALALSHFGQLSADDVAEKGHLDLVTVADKAVERLVVERLLAAFPGDGVFGEEGGRDKGTSGRAWVIDPIDGTFNFVRGGDEWGVSVGLYAEGRPVLGAVLQPARRRLFTGGEGETPCLNGKPLPALSSFHADTACTGLGLGGANPAIDGVKVMRRLTQDGRSMVRVTNACTASMAELALGLADGYVSCGESSWDVMGMWPILAALGATSTLDWNSIGLSDRIHFILGKPDFVAAFSAYDLWE